MGLKVSLDGCILIFIVANLGMIGLDVLPNSLSSLVFGADCPRLSFTRVPTSVFLRFTNSLIIPLVFSLSVLRNMTLQTDSFDIDRGSE